HYFFFPSSAASLHLHSFPTRRSSDLAVARAKGILRLPSLLTDQRLIDQEEERPRQPAFHHQQLATQRCGWRQPAQQFPSQKAARSEEHTSELQSRGHLVCRLLLEKKN